MDRRTKDKDDDTSAKERPTLKTLAFMTGLGVTTVSRALKDAPEIGAERVTGAYPEDSSWFDRLVGSLLLKAENLRISSEMILETPALRQQLLGGDPNSIAAYALVQQDFSAALRRLRTPTLLIWGSDDRIVPSAHASAVPAHARVELLQGQGHSPHMEASGDVNRLLEEFVAGAKTAA